MKLGEPKYPEEQNDPVSDSTYRAIIDRLLLRQGLSHVTFSALDLQEARHDNALFIMGHKDGSYTASRA